MVTEIKSTSMSIEEEDAIENEMYERGYLTHEYIVPAKTMETDVVCPICGENLTLSVYGNSHQIKCKTDLCTVITIRGL